MLNPYFSVQLRSHASSFGSSLKKYALDYLRQPLYEQGYLQIEERKRFMFITQTKFVLTEKVQQAQRRINSLLAEGDNLGAWVDSDPGRAKAYLSVCGPNVLLLEQYDLNDDDDHLLQPEQLGDLNFGDSDLGFDSAFDSDLGGDGGDGGDGDGGGD